MYRTALIKIMTPVERTHLDQLENQSIFIFREAYHAFKNIAMPWSMGKDSNVLIWLARKSFFGKVPFPVLHIDTTYEFPEMLEFREWATKHYNLNLIVKINTEARERGIGYETHDPVTVTHELKTVALQQALADYKWDAPHHRYSSRRRSDSGEGEILFAAQRTVRMGLQGSAARILGPIRDVWCKRRACSCATAARLDRGRCLALYPKGGDPDPENVFCTKWKTVSFARLQPHYTSSREHCIDNRRNYCRTRSDKNDRARRPGPGLL